MIRRIAVLVLALLPSLAGAQSMIRYIPPPGVAPVGGSFVANCIPYASSTTTLLCTPATSDGSSIALARTVGVTSADGYTLLNNTAAAAGAQQWSPRFRWSGAGWKTNATAASQAVDIITELRTVQGEVQAGFGLETRAQLAGGGYVRAALLGYAPATTANGQGNTFYGYTAGGVTSDDVTVVGAYNNSFFGGESGQANTTGYQNTFVGSRSGGSNTTGFQNTFVGQGAGYSTTTLGGQVAVGHHALLNNTGNNNVALGHFAGESTAAASTTSNNVFVGAQAGRVANSSSAGNVLVGFTAGLAVTSGLYNTAVGYQSGLVLTSGGGNVLLGRETGKALTTQSDNVMVGKLAGLLAASANNTMVGSVSGLSNTSGANNTFLGYGAGYTATAGNANVSGSSNTYVGYNAGPSTATQLSNASALGAGALVSASNQAVIGDANVTEVQLGTGGVAKGTMTSVLLLPVAFAALGTPANGTVSYCSDCTIASPCADSGTGALAKRLNGAWVCN